MQFVEAMSMLLARPEMRAILDDRHCLMLNPAGRLVEDNGKRRDYARLGIQAIMAATWVCYTVEQLLEAARQAELEAQRGGGSSG